MKRYRYALDWVCWTACVFYAVNRWVMPHAWKTPFLRNHFDDLLFIPAALPLMLWLERRLHLRAHDAPPTWREVIEHWAIWSVATEWVGPKLFPWTVGDIWDVVSYAAGALVAAIIWNAAPRPVATATPALSPRSRASRKRGWQIRSFSRLWGLNRRRGPSPVSSPAPEARPVAVPPTAIPSGARGTTAATRPGPSR